MYNTDKIWDNIYEDFKNHKPGLVSQVIEWFPSGRREITLVFKDGTQTRFDFYNKTLRPVAGNTYDYEEAEWRKLFAKKLDRQMRIRACTVEDLSDDTGISRVTIYKYLRGESTPSVFHLRKIARSLDCHIDILTDDPIIELPN